MKLLSTIGVILFIAFGLWPQPSQARPISRSEVKELLTKGLLKPDSSTATTESGQHIRYPMSYRKNLKPFTPAANYMSLTGYLYLRLLQDW